MKGLLRARQDAPPGHGNSKDTLGELKQKEHTWVNHGTVAQVCQELYSPQHLESVLEMKKDTMVCVS